MIAIRAAKVATVAAIALFASLVAFGNLTDYDTNLAFVQHVLSMDTTFASSTIKYRAITDPALQRVAYALIIATEAATAVLCWIGAGVLARRLSADAAAFNRAKSLAIVGLTLGFLLWHVGVAALERRAQRVPLPHDQHRRADLRGDPGSGAGAERDVNPGFTVILASPTTVHSNSSQGSKEETPRSHVRWLGPRRKSQRNAKADAICSRPPVSSMSP